jgi:hypothetical protein
LTEMNGKGFDASALVAGWQPVWPCLHVSTPKLGSHTNPKKGELSCAATFPHAELPMNATLLVPMDAEYGWQDQ